MDEADDTRLAWAHRGLIMLGVVGVVAIGWAVWLLTTTTSQSAEADRAAAIQQRELAAALATVTPTPPPTPTAAPTATPPPTSTPAPTPTPAVQVPSGSAVVPPPTPTPTATSAPAATATPTPTTAASEEAGLPPAAVVNNDGQQVGTSLVGWYGFDEFPPDFSGPELNEGPNQVSFTLVVQVPDGGGETFSFADSSGQTPNTVGASRQTYGVPTGTFTIEPKSPSGWPSPAVTCVGAEQVGTQGSVTMELEADTDVECTFVLVRDADSLSVLDTMSSCDGLTGRVLGPEGPFWITYQAEGPKSPGGGFSLFAVGTIRVERPGRFITPPDFIAQAGLDDGDYPIWITVWDDTGSYVPFLDAATLSVGDCG